MNLYCKPDDFAPGRQKIFVRYKDGLSRSFEFDAITVEGWRVMMEQFCPRIDNIVYMRSRCCKNTNGEEIKAL